jgi:SAM-dependent methyltransferase
MARNGSPRRRSHFGAETVSKGFSPEWLHLREQADTRARNSEIAESVSAHFALRDQVTIVDLGCGTGSNLRATAQLLPSRQTWTLADHDLDLIANAKTELRRWADRSDDNGECLRLHKGHALIDVTFTMCDLAQDLANVLGDAPNLITASAFFDLVSTDFIRRIVKAAAERNAALYALLTYNGRQKWTPHRPTDNQMIAAFHRHQMRDKGFGPAAGPLAAAELADQLKMSGYTVLEGESPWILDRNDRMLIDELVRGHAMAVSETGTVDLKTIETWVKVQRTGAVVGHTDIFAVPS